jgi:hypothetical protein
VNLAVLTGAALLGVTELLGLLHQLTPPSIATFWLLWAAWLALAVFRIARLANQRPKRQLWDRKARDVAIVIVIASTVLLTGLTALFAAPNTYDSMTYHPARVAHWQQQASVGFYPTAYLPQLYQPP